SRLRAPLSCSLLAPRGRGKAPDVRSSTDGRSWVVPACVVIALFAVVAWLSMLTLEAPRRTTTSTPTTMAAPSFRGELRTPPPSTPQSPRPVPSPVPPKTTPEAWAPLPAAPPGFEDSAPGPPGEELPLPSRVEPKSSPKPLAAPTPQVLAEGNKEGG